MIYKVLWMTDYLIVACMGQWLLEVSKVVDELHVWKLEVVTLWQIIRDKTTGTPELNFSCLIFQLERLIDQRSRLCKKYTSRWYRYSHWLGFFLIYLKLLLTHFLYSEKMKAEASKFFNSITQKCMCHFSQVMLLK